MWRLFCLFVSVLVFAGSQREARSVTFITTLQVGATYNSTTGAVESSNSMIIDGDPHIYRVDTLMRLDDVDTDKSFGAASFDIVLNGGISRNTLTVSGSGLTNPKPNFVANNPAIVNAFDATTSAQVTNYFTGGLTGDKGSSTSDLAGVITAVNPLNLGNLVDGDTSDPISDPRLSIGIGSLFKVGSVYISWDGASLGSISLKNVVVALADSNSLQFDASEQLPEFSLPVNPVPEPATLALIAVGLTCLFVVKSRVRIATLAIAANLCFLAQQSFGNIVATQQSNYSVPPDDAGFFNNVGSPDSAGSVVYLGSGWAITAAHVDGLSTVTFGGDTATIIGQSLLPSKFGGTPDIRLLHLASTPYLESLPSLQISPTRTPLGARVLMIGGGLVEDGPPTLVDGVPHFSVMPSPGGAIRWGENIVSQVPNLVQTPHFNYQSIAALVQLDHPTYTGHPQLPSEAMAGVGDSGGGVFLVGGDGVGPRLAGLMITGADAGGTPYGNGTFFVDLAPYRQDIISITSGAGGILGDTNADGVVDSMDRANISNHLGDRPRTSLVGDTNKDNAVNIQDYINVTNNLGQTLPPLFADTNGDHRVDLQDYINILNNLGTGDGIHATPFDTDANNRIDLQDYINVVDNLGTTATVLGDTNRDGVVDLQDYINVVNNLGDHFQPLIGDTNGDDVVNLDDYINVYGVAPVPEPSTFALLAIGGIVLGLAHRSAAANVMHRHH